MLSEALVEKYKNPESSVSPSKLFVLFMDEYNGGDYQPKMMPLDALIHKKKFIGQPSGIESIGDEAVLACVREAHGRRDPTGFLLDHLYHPFMTGLSTAGSGTAVLNLPDANTLS